MKNKVIILFFLLLNSLIFSQTKIKEVKNIVVQNHYWAKKGQVEAVYAHRLYASAVRKKLGLAVGRVLVRTDSNSDYADVIWECNYKNEAARKEDVRLLTEAGVFEEVQKKMTTLITKFKRITFKVE